MNTFYIARHGQTENNRAGRLSGWIDTPLTEAGLLPTEAVIAKLAHVPITDMYASDLGRAFITAYVIARKLRFTNEIGRLPGLREVSYGDAANMLSKDAYAMYPGLDSDTHFTPPNGESLDVMQRRVFATLADLNRTHTNATIVLVCHSGVMAAIRASHLGVDFGGHNISEAYAHDYVAKFTLQDDGSVDSFEEVL
jgi:phosphoserine phosphatase